jgi:hypothetical protein
MACPPKTSPQYELYCGLVLGECQFPWRHVKLSPCTLPTAAEKADQGVFIPILSDLWLISIKKSGKVRISLTKNAPAFLAGTIAYKLT